MSKLKIKDLIPDEANFNTGTEFGNSLIDKSLSKFGAGRSILIDKNNRIIAGNKTIENAAANGFDDIVIVETTGEQIVAVKRTDIDLNTKKGREMALADNATAKANISWDAQTLTEWDMPIQEWGIDLSDITEVEPAGDADAEPQIDKAAELNKKWGVVSGDLWQIGEHRLLCGDSTKREDVERLMDGEQVQMVWTDPPYGIAYEQGGIEGLTTSAGAAIARKQWQMIANDDVTLDCHPFIEMADEVFIFGADYLIPEMLPTGAVIVWDKRGGASDEFHGSWFELCWSKQKHQRKIARIEWQGIRGVKDDMRGSRSHPTQKPVQLVKWFLEQWGSSGDLVFDPFLGSGTTLVACQNLNRKCYAIEISENYCAVILERMATAFPDIEIKRIDG